MGLTNVLVKPDLIEASYFTEEYGQITEATRTFYVEGTAAATDTLGTILLYSLQQPGVPQPGDALDSEQAIKNVRCERRDPRLVMRKSDNKVGVKITCLYSYQPSQDESVPISGGASLATVQQQVVEGAAGKTPITVTYGSETVGATVDVLDVRAHFSREIVERLTGDNDPDDTVDDWVNHVNSDQFRGKPKGSWLCTNVEWFVVNKPAHVYRFVYEFEYRPEGWTYAAVYHRADGSIPSDISEPGNAEPATRGISKGNGITLVKWHPSKNFSEKFA